MSDLPTLATYESFLVSGDRVVHSQVQAGMAGLEGIQPTVLSLYRGVYSDHAWQPMEANSSYGLLTAAGIPVHALKREFRPELGPLPFTPEDQETAFTLAAGKSAVTSLTEMPVAFLSGLGLEIPIVASLYHTEPESRRPAFDDLVKAIAVGQVAMCTIDSYTGRAAYIAAGVPESRIVTITNGTDLDRFKPSAEHRRDVRDELLIPYDAPVVALGARYDPIVKGIDLFLDSAKLYLAQSPEAHVVMAGSGMNRANAALLEKLQTRFADNSELLERLHLLGIRNDMERVFAAADVISSTSLSESRPISLMEGGLCGAIPVATQAGDTGDIIRDKGIMTSRDPQEVANAWDEAFARKSELFWTPEFSARFDQMRTIATYARVIRSVAS